jgi:hypothetical protein
MNSNPSSSRRPDPGGPGTPDSGADAAQPRRLAEAVRAACIQAALASYQDALMDGLCAEGAWECAIGAMQALDLRPLVGKEDSLASS